MKKIITASIFLFSLTTLSFTQNAKSLSFDGIDDYVEVPDHSSNDLITDFTVQVSGKADSTNSQKTLLRKGWCQAGGNAYNLRIENGKIIWHWSTTSPCNTGEHEYQSNDSLLANGDCFDITVIHSSTSVQIYLNNNLVNGQLTMGNYAAIFNSSQPLTIGSYKLWAGNQGSFFNGTINDVRFWNYKLSPAEIAGYSNQILSGNENGLIAYYSFDQGIDGGNNTSTNSLTAGTSGSINGALINFNLTGSSSNWITDSCSVISTEINTINITKPIASAYPNPFTESTTISFNKVPLQGNDIVIIDALGKEVKKIENNKNREITIYTKETGKGLFFVFSVNNSSKERHFLTKIIAQ